VKFTTVSSDLPSKLALNARRVDSMHEAFQKPLCYGRLLVLHLPLVTRFLRTS